MNSMSKRISQLEAENAELKRQVEMLLDRLETLIGFAEKNNVFPDTIYVRDAVRSSQEAIESVKGNAE